MARGRVERRALAAWLLCAGSALLVAASARAQQDTPAPAPAPDADTNPPGGAEPAADQQRTKAGAHFCQAATVGRLRADAAAKKVFCFYDIQDDFRPQDLNPCLCTHVVYSYVAVRKNLSFIAGKKGDLRALASLKRKNPSLKLLVSLRPDDYFAFDVADAGDTTPTPAANASRPEVTQQPEPEPQPARANEMHQKFAKRVRDFIVRHSLDGINLDWPYFAQTMGGGARASRQHLGLVLEELNESLQGSLAQSSPSAAYLRRQAPIVTLTASKDFYQILDGYDFHRTAPLLDFVHLPAFDFDLNVDQFSIGHPARLHGISDAENLDTLVDLLLSGGLPSEQLVAGIPAHGVQITSRPQPGPEPPARGRSSLDEQLEAAANISIVSHAEVCRIRDLARQNCSARGPQEAGACWTMSRARDLTAPFAYDAEHWLGFDDETSVKLKAKYALLRHLGGVAMFTVNHDDPQGLCGFGPYPLLATVNGVLARAAAASAPAAAAAAAAGFTRAPGQLLTATSLVSQVFGKKLQQAAGTTPAPSPAGDLMGSASERSDSLMSFADIIEKYGAVHRLEAAAGRELEELRLACDRVGYQRYPRDCSRFYRCLQTPPATPSSAPPAAAPAAAAAAAAATTTRLQYECPSGLVFDEQYQICNWPSWSAQCQGSGEVNAITNSRFQCPNYGYFQNQENCEYFYYCSDYNRDLQQARAYQFRCPFELGFDEERLQCNWKWLVKGCGGDSAAAAAAAAAANSTGTRLARAYLEGQGLAEPRAGRVRRSAPPAPEARSRALAELSNRLTSLLVSVAAFAEDQAAKKRGAGMELAPNAGHNKSAAAAGRVGEPSSTTPAPPRAASTKSFRARRRQAALQGGGQQADSAAPASGLPYARPPAPPSIFPFLPTSFLYMLADSLRSVGEAVQAELNRYLRLAGDRVRRILGPHQAQARRRELADGARRKRARRHAGPDQYGTETGDLQALESAQPGGPVYVAPPAQRPAQRQHRDPLGRPPGYPLNPLDELAKAAVLGPEPKVFSQPSALASGQMSAISQQELERLLKSAREAFYQPQVPHRAHPADYMMASGSELQPQSAEFGRDRVVERLVEQARQQQPAPFGMPLQPAKNQQQAVKGQAPDGQVDGNKRKRTTVAMKLANLAIPRFVTRAPPSFNFQQQQQQPLAPKPPAGPPKGYKSFLPSLTPARNLMHKAMDLISTLAPGGKNGNANHNQEADNKPKPGAGQQQARLASTTPMPRLMQQQPSNQHLFFHSFESQQANRSKPLLLTEQEARALSAQLDLLTKEQLEALSAGLALNDAAQHAPPQRPHQHQLAPPPPPQQQPTLQQQQQQRPNDDYVSRLLKMLSQTSHNPEDVRLLEQLASQLNNPQQSGGPGEQLIEVGQPDDVALLEALGLVPHGHQAQAQPQAQRQQFPAPGDGSHNGTRGDMFGAEQQTYAEHNFRPDHLPKSVRLEELPGATFLHFEQEEPSGSSSSSNDNNGYNYARPSESYEQPQPYQGPNYEYPTTTTTQRPQIQQVTEEQQVVERPMAPVKQTFTEIIESNTTTPDGVETSLESRTKSAISAGAGFALNAQIGLGLVPGRPFDGLAPSSNSSEPPVADKGSAEGAKPEVVSLGGVKGGPPLASASGLAGSTFSGTTRPGSNNQPAGAQITMTRTSNFGSDGSQTVDQVNSFSTGGQAQMGAASLASYNFATQPVSQYEEVVIKKKFKPFPKQVMVPTEIRFEETRNSAATPVPVSLVQQQAQGSSSSSFQADEQQAKSNQGANQQEHTLVQQVRDDEVSSTAASFGETSVAVTSAPAVESLTKQDIRQGQQAQDTQQRLQLLLSQQQQQLEEANRQQEQNLGAQQRLEQSLESEGATASTLKASDASESSTTPRPKRSKRRKSKKVVNSTNKSTKAPRLDEEAKERRTRNQPAGNGSRVEAAFSNFMVELKRSRNVTTGVLAKTIVDQQQQQKAPKRKLQGAKKAAKKQSESLASASSDRHLGDLERAPQSQQPSTRRPKKQTKRRQQPSGGATNGKLVLADTRQRPMILASPREQVAIYGTKSGFIPMIAPDNPNYQASDSQPRQVGQEPEPMHMGASLVQVDRQQSWRNFVRLLSDQISVVNLGNHSDSAGGVVQVRLVILPASPNNQLLDNWHHLAQHYPQLFPPKLAETGGQIEPIELGESSIISTSGLIDEHEEARRLDQFRGQFESISRLIERRTFKALDEIVQRSSGRLFMMQRRDEPSRTIIAVIPDRQPIKPTLSASDGGSASAALYQRQVSLPTTSSMPTTTTTAVPPTEISTSSSSSPLPTTTTTTTTTTTSELPFASRRTPPTTFSRAIQESIQGAIRQRLDIMKEQLKSELAATTASSAASTQTTAWSTPASETLANLNLNEPPATTTMAAAATTTTTTTTTTAEPTQAAKLPAANSLILDPLEVSSSSTEFTLAMPDSQRLNQSSLEPARKGSNYTSQSLFEVDGAEAKSLYGLELNAHPSQQQQQQAIVPSGNKQQRFISIGSHLMAAPLRPPQVVDQAYVSHFYDHISESPQAKAANFEEMLTTAPSVGDSAASVPTPVGGSTSGQQAQGGQLGEDSLVPESACTRAGLFQHPFACNKFYECFWDKPLNKFTLHMFECPIKLAFDERIVGCAMPIESALCVNY